MCSIRIIKAFPLIEVHPSHPKRTTVTHESSLPTGLFTPLPRWLPFAGTFKIVRELKEFNYKNGLQSKLQEPPEGFGGGGRAATLGKARDYGKKDTSTPASRVVSSGMALFNR